MASSMTHRDEQCVISFEPHGDSAALRIVAARQRDRVLAPSFDRASELLKSSVVEFELVTSQAPEPPKHLRENIRREPAILLGGKHAEMPQSVAWLDGHQICEVPRLGATEDGKNLVDGQLLTTQRRCRLSRLGRKEPRVGTQINLRAFAVALHDESGETRCALHVSHDEARSAQRPVDGGNESIDGRRSQAEEVQVTRASINLATDDQGGSARQRKSLRFVKAGDDRRDLLLQRAQHLPAATPRQPGLPRIANPLRQDELVPQLQQLIGVDIQAHILGRPFTENLFVDAGPVGAIV